MENKNAPFLSASFERSTNLAEAEYDSFMQVLSLKFRNGSTYDYINVEQKVFVELKNADSAGHFFHTKIRGKYDFLKRVPAYKEQSADLEPNEEGQENEENILEDNVSSHKIVK